MAAACDRVVIALPPGASDARSPASVPDAVGVRVVAGGASRSESVLAAIRTAPDANAFVVHDAARPLVTRALIERCVAALDAGWDGAVAAAPMTDTVKETGPDGGVLRTLDRSRLWAVQTPQVFAADWLRRALDVSTEALAAASDDASLVEAAGGRVTVVEAPPENVKVTRPADLAAAAARLTGPERRRC